jgi:hypothetical protein
MVSDPNVLRNALMLIPLALSSYQIASTWEP